MTKNDAPAPLRGGSASKPSPRRRRRLLAPLLACVFLNISAAPNNEAHTGQNAKVDSQQTAPKKAGAKESAKAARARRETREAVTALKESAELAREFEDVYESVRAQSEAADAVWPFDEQWARSVLRRAWDATNAPGAEEHVQGFGTSDDPREDALDALTTARRFVIKAALKHDPRFGEALMREFERVVAEHASAGGQGATPNAAGTARPPRRLHTLSAAGRHRLTLARQLLDDGDFRGAASVAAPLAAEGANSDLLIFILTLRSHYPEGADALYLRLLAAAHSDPRADANDVLLLSTPVVSPDLIIFLNPDGSAGLIHLRYASADGRAAAASLPAVARLAFYDTAAAVLLRPRPPRAAERPGEDAAGVYFAVGRLLPFFEREAPQLAPALNARLVSLAAELEVSRRDALKSKMELSSLTPKNPTDPLALPLEGVRRASNSTDRDFARLLVVAGAARLTLWDRARAVTEEMEGAEMRRAARLVVNIQQAATVRRVYEDEGPEAFERAAAFVRAADVPPEARALGLAQAAELAALAGARTSADSLLSEAAGLAAESDDRTRRAHALALVTLSAARAGSARAWEVLPAFVRAADETDDLHYGAMALEFHVGVDDRKLWVAAPASPVSLEGLFAAAARLDAVKTFAEARGFKDEYLRASALLGAGRETLNRARAASEKGGRAERPAAR